MYRKLKIALPLLTLMSLVAIPPAEAKKKKAADASAAEATATDTKSGETKTRSAAAKKGQTDLNLKVDINNASETDLDKLPGVGKATAKKIIAGRPYKSAQDLSKAGVSAKTIQEISPMVVVGPASSAMTPPQAATMPKSKRASNTTPAPTPSVAPSSAPTSMPMPTATKSAPAASSTSTVAQQPPQKGMVWVNLETTVYHREGQRWYGNTKKGKFMTEADAQRAGYRASKE